MNRMRSAALCAASAVLIAGCSPLIIVENHTRFPIRAFVSQERTNAVSPSPGESSSVEATEGAYSVAVIPEQEWLEYAKLTRKVLIDELADPDHLTGAQLLDVINRLKDVAATMDEFQRAAGSQASCGGSVSEGGSSLVTVATGASGGLVVSCK